MRLLIVGGKTQRKSPYWINVGVVVVKTSESDRQGPRSHYSGARIGISPFVIIVPKCGQA